MKPKKWYHISEFGASSIVQLDKPPEIYGDVNHYGPFDTFDKCKMDAIQYHLSDKFSAQESINKLRKIKKSDFNP